MPCPADLRVRRCELPSDCAASRSVARPDTPATQLNGPLQGAWQRGRSRPRVEPWAGAEAGLGGGRGTEKFDKHLPLGQRCGAGEGEGGMGVLITGDQKSARECWTRVAGWGGG